MYIASYFPNFPFSLLIAVHLTGIIKQDRIAAKNGIQDFLIKTMGHWESPACMLYIYIFVLQGTRCAQWQELCQSPMGGMA